MRQQVKDFEKEHLFFVTSTIIKWVPIFQDVIYADIILDSLNFITRNEWVNIYAFVLMPDHLHLILKLLGENRMEKVNQNFHKFTANRIIKVMKGADPHLLSKFMVKRKDRLYQIWKRDTNFKNIYSAKFLLQKAEYIHNNPIQPEWRLVDCPEDYPYSIAAYYLSEKPFQFFKLTDLRDLV